MRTVALFELLFGLVTLVGGVIGFVSADSLVSLIAGIAAGGLLLVAGLQMQKGSRRSMYICMIVSLALAIDFGIKVFSGSTRAFPEWAMMILGLLSILLIVLLLVQPAERKRIF